MGEGTSEVGEVGDGDVCVQSMEEVGSWGRADGWGRGVSEREERRERGRAVLGRGAGLAAWAGPVGSPGAFFFF